MRTTQGATRLHRMDAGAEQRFVGVDVADPRKHRLVEQGDLHGTAGPPETLVEDVRGDFMCFRTQATQKASTQILGALGEMDAAESPGVDEVEAPPGSGGVRVEHPDDVSMPGGGSGATWSQIDASRHAEPENDRAAALEVQHELLASTAHSIDSSSDAEGVRIEPSTATSQVVPNHVAATHHDPIDPHAGQGGREVATDRFDFGELGHGAMEEGAGGLYSGVAAVLAIFGTVDGTRAGMAIRMAS